MIDSGKILAVAVLALLLVIIAAALRHAAPIKIVSQVGEMTDEFNRDAWARNPDYTAENPPRRQMSEDLILNHLPAGMPISQVEDLLGYPPPLPTNGQAAELLPNANARGKSLIYPLATKGQKTMWLVIAFGPGGLDALGRTGGDLENATLRSRLRHQILVTDRGYRAYHWFTGQWKSARHWMPRGATMALSATESFDRWKRKLALQGASRKAVSLSTL